MSKLVSIIIPAYNADHFLAETLSSVGKQSYANWELLVIEDGSRDRTEELVKVFSESVPSCDVRYIRHTVNKGLSAARNTGIKAARGEYIAFLDADDLWREDHLKNAIETLERENVGLVYSRVDCFEDSPSVKTGSFGPSTQNLEAFPESLLTRMGSFIICSALVVKRSIFDSVEGFDPAIKIAEDYDFFIRASAANLKFYYIPKITCLYRRGHTSLSSDAARIKGANAKVLLVHKHTPLSKKEVWKESAFMACLIAAKDYERLDFVQSAYYLFEAWKIKPFRKIKYLMGVFFLCAKSLLYTPTAESASII